MIDPSIIPLLPDRYAVLDQIDRGGMGVVWQVVDRHFDRLLAVKVMLPSRLVDEDAVRRFNREAQLTGTLQHPAIPPVVDRGLLADGAPYFSMKLVEGETLANLLKRHPTSPSDLARLVGIFEQVCQAVGYAHSQGIIHRDLKPANIMVGAFGEVQVMDWGMAKRLGEPNPVKPSQPSRGDFPVFDPEASTVHFVIEESHAESDTQPVSEDVTLTRAGQVLGTLAYMPPEQARGDSNEIDSRADVFALGGVLCKILTGQAPYMGTALEALYHQVLAGDVTEAISAVATCSADDELVSLCRACLAKDPAERPQDASVVAERVRLYEEATRQRLEAERTERATSEVRAVEEHKRRRVQLTLAGVFLMFLLLGTAAAMWHQRDQAERRIAAAADAARLQAEQRAREDRARGDIASALQQVPVLQANYQFEAAELLLHQAKSRLSLLPKSDAFAKRVQQQQADLRLVRELDRIRLKKSTWGQGHFETDFANGSDGAYAKAFRSYGVDLIAGDLEAISQQIAASSHVAEIISALDDWMKDEHDSELKSRLGRIATRADKDVIRNRLRKTVDRQKLADFVDQLTLPLPPALAVFVSSKLRKLDDSERSAQVLEDSLSKHPQDFWLHYTLASPNSEHGLSDEARIAHYQAAIAIRPQSSGAYTNLGLLFHRKHKYIKAERAYRTAIELNPKNAVTHSNLGSLLDKQHKTDEAEQNYRRAIEFDPKYALAYNNLGLLFKTQQRYGEAEVAFRTAVELDPQNARILKNLGNLLKSQQKFEEAEKAFREAIQLDRKATELDPKGAEIHNNLGQLLCAQQKYEEAEQAFRAAIRLDPNNAKWHYNLGFMLADQKKYEEAKQAYQRAIELDPNYARPHNDLGIMLRIQQKFGEAEQAFRRSIEIDPEDANTHDNLGQLLYAQQKYDDAEQAFRTAIQLDPKNAKCHNNLGFMLADQKKYDEAERAYQRAIELDPNYARPHNDLGAILQDQQRYAEAEQTFRRAIEIDPQDANTYYNLGNLFYAWKKYEDAEVAFRRAIQLDPKLALAHNNLGLLLEMQQKFEEAKQAFRRAIELDPKSSLAYTNLAHLLADKKKYGEAEKACRTAIEIDPKNAELHNDMGVVLANQQKFEAAERAFRKSLELDPKYTDAKENLGLLRKIQNKDEKRSTPSAPQ